jgi:hypothetical protein
MTGNSEIDGVDQLGHQHYFREPTSTKPLARRTHFPFSEQSVISGDELI